MTELLSARAVARLMKVSHTSVNRWIRRGDLKPSGYVGNSIAIFDRKVVDDYIAVRRRNPPRRGRPRKNPEQATPQRQ